MNQTARRAMLGECVFATWNGLEVDATGHAVGLKTNSSGVEFRYSELGGTEYIPRGDLPALFLRKLRMNVGDAVLLGALQRMADSNGRPGFAGAGVLLSDARLLSVDIAARVSELFHDFEDHMLSLRERGSASARLKFFGDVAHGRSVLDLWRSSPPRLHANAGLKPDDTFLHAMGVYLDAVDNQTATVIVGLESDSRYPPLSINGIKDERRTRAEADKRQRKEERSKQQAYSKRAKTNFDRRTVLLKGPRPKDVTPEFEQYLVDLMQYVIRSTKGTGGKPPLGPHADPGSSKAGSEAESLIGKIWPKR